MLILNRSETRALLDLRACVEAVERAFAEHGAGRALPATRVHVASGDGAFHVTAGGASGVFGIKANGRFPGGVNGAILLQDASDGRPLALLDSQAVTILRTAAATAVAVRHLARRDARRALLVGAGRQAPAQIEALALALPLERLAIWSRTRGRAEAVAASAAARGIEAAAVDTLAAEVRESDVIVTATPATAPLLAADDVPAGSLVVALGADGPGKQELDPRLVAGATLVVDVLDQAAHSGELAHSLAAGLMTRADVHAELGEIVAGTKPGRRTDDERIVFDSTGTALQDVAGALVIVEAARARGVGVRVAVDA